MLTRISVNRTLWLTLLACTILLYFIFAPGINLLYYAGDDFRYAFGGWNQACKLDDGFEFMLTLGRPIQAYMDCLNFKFAHTLERMSLIRMSSVILMGICMGLLVSWFRKLRFSFVCAFFASGCFFVTQKLYSNTILMGSNSLPFAVLMAILGYLCIEKTENNSLNKRWLLAGGFAIFCAFLSYPAMAFFFTIMIFSKLLFSNLADWPATATKIFKEVGVFCVVCSLYFLYAYYRMHYHPLAPVSEQYQVSHPNIYFSEIYRRFVTMMNVFHGPWKPFPLSSLLMQGWLMVGILIGGVGCGVVGFFRSQFYLSNKRAAVITLFQMSGTGIALFLLCSGFYFIIPKPESMDSQILFATAASGLPLLFWALYRISEQLNKVIVLIGLGLFFVVGGYQANVILMRDALMRESYINATRKEIAGYLQKNPELHRIHFVIPRSNYPYDRFFLTNVAIMPLIGKGHYQLVWCSLPRGFNGEEKNHQVNLLQCVNNLVPGNIAVTYSYDGDIISKTPKMLVIKNQREDFEPHNLV